MDQTEWVRTCVCSVNLIGSTWDILLVVGQTVQGSDDSKWVAIRTGHFSGKHVNGTLCSENLVGARERRWALVSISKKPDWHLIAAVIKAAIKSTQRHHNRAAMLEVNVMNIWVYSLYEATGLSGHCWFTAHIAPGIDLNDCFQNYKLGSRI